MTKQKINKVTIGASILFGLLVGILLVTQMTWFDYQYDGVQLTHDISMQQCTEALQNHYDVEEDLINNERTATDDRGFSDMQQLKDCKMLIENPNRILRGAYGNFWAGFIGMNLMILFAIMIVSLLTWYMLDNMIN